MVERRMLNPVIAQLLTEMADLSELRHDNPFRIRAFRRGALAVDSHPDDVGTLDRKALLEIPGIGKGIADLIDEVRATGKSKEHEELKKKFPEGVLQVMRLPGLGAKRAALLFSELNIDSV